ncbi:MAG: PDZ domain-containing protein [Rhodospirillales bacterium]
MPASRSSPCSHCRRCSRARDIGAGPYDDFLQIDAAINQGNSGGPSFGRDGKVIGMNTAIFSPNGGSVGLGFAIPSNLVRKVVDQLRVHGSVDRAWLGVQTQSIDETLAAALKLPSAQGALIGSVQKNSPADQAGLRRGDVILALDSSAIGDPRDLSRRVGDLASGTKATFDIWRDGRRIATTVALGAAPADAAPVAVAAPEPQTPVAGLGLRLARGGQGETIVAEIAQDGLAEQAGLRPGDVLLEADRQRIRGPNDLAAALRTARQTQRPGIALFLSRDGQPLYLALPVPALRG